MGAVSYTHLDVYKRQRLTGGLYGVFTKEAQMNPAMQEPSEQQNMVV